MTVSELKALIANHVKDKGLNNILSPEIMENIKEKIMSKYHLHKASSQIPELIPESDGPSPPMAAGGTVEFPKDEDAKELAFDTNLGMGQPENSGRIGMEPGAEETENLEEPKMGYAPELPNFIDKIEPAKVIIFSQNELSLGGENLANEPLRTFSNPDIKKSIHEFWIEDGKKRAEVYIAKLEKIGEVEFDYRTGVAKFVEKRMEPELPTLGTDKENILIQAPEQKICDIPELSNTMESDDSKNVQNIIMEAIQEALKKVGLDKKKEFTPAEVKFELKMLDLVNEDNGYMKVNTPDILIERISKSDKSCLIRENEEVQEWISDNGKSYFLPTKPLSIKKCYIRK